MARDFVTPANQDFATGGGNSSGGVSASVVVVDTTTDVQGAVATAIESLRDSTTGRLSGTLRLGPKTARLGTPLDIDCGFTNTPPAGTVWMSDTRQRLTLDLPNLFFDAGSRNNLKIHGGFGVQLNLGVNGGGAYGAVTDGAIVSGQSTLTSANAVAAGVAVGDWVTVAGAGAQLGVGNLPLKATVRSVAGNVLTLSMSAGATVTSASVRWMTTAISLYDLVGLTGSVYGKNYAGVLIGMDATGSNPNSAGEANPRHIRTAAFQSIIGIGCGATLHAKSIEAFGTWGDIFSGSVYGDYLGNCADMAWNKYEGGVGIYGYTGGIPYSSDGIYRADNYLWLDTVNNCQFGAISVGDRANGPNVRISGGNVGTIHKLRSTGASASFKPVKGVELLDVNSITIDNLHTAWSPIGLHIVGGGQNNAIAAPYNGIWVKSHQSLTTDDVPLRISPSDTQSASNVDIKARYRSCTNQAVIIDAGMTGGRLTLDGTISQFNTGNTAIYGGDCGSDNFVVELASTFRQERRGASTAGGWNHTKPANLKLKRGAFVGDKTLHGWMWTAWGPQITDGFVTNHSALVSTVAQQNDSPYTLNVRIAVRFQPISGTNADFGLYLARQASEFNSGSSTAVYVKYDSTGANDEIHEVSLSIPPWHWISANMTATTVNRMLWSIE